LYYAIEHAAISVAVASGVVVLLVAKLLGILGLLRLPARTGKEARKVGDDRPDALR
jgi:uncharacterized membrane protein